MINRSGAAHSTLPAHAQKAYGPRSISPSSLHAGRACRNSTGVACSISRSLGRLASRARIHLALKKCRWPHVRCRPSSFCAAESASLLLSVANMTTADGFQYFPGSGLVTGLPTKACVSPPARNNRSDIIYDAIIVGAGYTGLIACRELALRGMGQDHHLRT